MDYAVIEDFTQLIDIARQECEGKKYCPNLIIKVSFSIDLIDDPFQGLFVDDAKLWLNPQTPEELHFNHGRYLYEYGDGIQNIINELKGKPNSNRALYSILSMKEIINSGDMPIPSFFVTQFSLEGNDLLCTSYFRALEVSRFLPINITEICLMIQRIQKELPSIDNVYYCLHAFKAYYNPEFDCLKKAEIDRLPRGVIATDVLFGNKKRIGELLESKLNDSSVVEISGIEELYNALISGQEKTKDLYDSAFIRSVGKSLESLRKLQHIRTKVSYGREIDKLEEEMRKNIKLALEKL